MLYTNKTYYWSNGETGNTITVNEGGAYRVTAVLGNCSTSAQIDVPKNPENYLFFRKKKLGSRTEEKGSKAISGNMAWKLVSDWCH